MANFELPIRACSIEYIDHMGDDKSVAEIARVSFNRDTHGADRETTERDDRLISFLSREGHWSPFSHPKIQFRVQIPIFLARQWEKHRIGAVRGYDIFDMNEMSRRYVSSQPEYFIPEQWRSKPDGSIKQGSGQELDDETQQHINLVYSDILREVDILYYHLVEDMNVAPEQARMVLPQSMMTTWIETGSLMYWSRVYSQRADAHAQQEWKQIMDELNATMSRLFPVSWPVLTGQINP